MCFTRKIPRLSLTTLITCLFIASTLICPALAGTAESIENAVGDSPFDYAQAFALLRDEGRGELEITFSSFFTEARAYPIQGASWVECGLGCGCETHGGSHGGQDFGTRGGMPPALSLATGQVVFAAFDGGYGNVVAIDHGDGVVSRYAHLDEIWVDVGQMVVAGQQIGRVGSTGFAFGDHLHLELIIEGVNVDPMVFL